jgi:hypothetical protein
MWGEVEVEKVIYSSSTRILPPPEMFWRPLGGGHMLQVARSGGHMLQVACSGDHMLQVALSGGLCYR